MNDIANFTAVRRTSRPDATAHEDGGISVLVKLNVEPDEHWERFFSEQQGDLRLAEKATVSRRPRDAHPGVVGRALGIYFRIQSVSELTEATNKVDELIEATNRHYTEVFIPAEEKRADAERRKESERAALQAELDRVAAELLPPDGDKEPPPGNRSKPVPRIPTRSTRTSRDCPSLEPVSKQARLRELVAGSGARGGGAPDDFKQGWLHDGAAPDGW